MANKSTISNETMREIADLFIDNYCDAFGIKHCISILMGDCNLTDEQLLEMKFDKEDIDFVREHIDDPDFDWGEVDD